MIESVGRTKRLGGRVVVSDASFRCEPGSGTGFLGPNGAGKTTTMRMLCDVAERATLQRRDLKSRSQPDSDNLHRAEEP